MSSCAVDLNLFPDPVHPEDASDGTGSLGSLSAKSRVPGPDDQIRFSDLIRVCPTWRLKKWSMPHYYGKRARTSREHAFSTRSADPLSSCTRIYFRNQSDLLAAKQTVIFFSNCYIGNFQLHAQYISLIPSPIILKVDVNHDERPRC